LSGRDVSEDELQAVIGSGPEWEEDLARVNAVLADLSLKLVSDLIAKAKAVVALGGMGPWGCA
jgi:hypothetical protein